jgi:hypothetical protein
MVMDPYLLRRFRILLALPKDLRWATCCFFSKLATDWCAAPMLLSGFLFLAKYRTFTNARASYGGCGFEL